MRRTTSYLKSRVHLSLAQVTGKWGARKLRHPLWPVSASKRSWGSLQVPQVSDALALLPVLTLIVDKQFRKLFLERADFGTIADLYVRVVRILERVVLMVLLGPVETLQRSDLRHDGFRENLGRVELRDIGGCQTFLLVVD